MKSQALINLLSIVLLLAVAAAMIVAIWNSVPIPLVLATVSWNG